MASQVLSGASNPTYTNNTGQNVRVVINYMVGSSVVLSGTSGPTLVSITLNWAGVSARANLSSIGRNLAFFSGNQSTITSSTTPTEIESYAVANNALGFIPLGFQNAPSSSGALPTELMLAPGQTFSATCGIYNIVVIPEAG